MNVLIYNKSRKKSFRKSKRIISSVLPQISNRVNIGNIPKRIAIKLVEDLRKSVNRGTKIEVYIEDLDGYMGFKMFAIGKKSGDSFFDIKTKLDEFFQPIKKIISTPKKPKYFPDKKYL